MYALKYQCVFDPVGPVSETPVYKIEILQKGYSGQVYNCIGGAVPVLHQWETDDPKAPIKGSSLAITLVNKDGNLPLSSFFSTDDDDFLVKLSFSKSQTVSDTATVSVVPAGMGQTHVTINKPFDVTNATYFILDGVRYDIISASSDGTNTYLTTFGTPVIIGVVKDFSIVYSDKRVLFTGFLVQDDCSEQLVDFTHEINLSANDNLGLLKDVSLDKANIFSISYTSGTVSFGGDFPTRTFLFFDVDLSGQLLPGDRVEIISGSLTGIYTVIKVVNAAPNSLVYVEEPLPITAVYNTTFNIYTPANLLDKTPLSTILRMCLSVTGLNLNTNIYGKIIEVSQDATRSFLEQTLIDPQTFLKSDTEYTDCYDVLTKILDRFNMTLFQANGVWNIVRWDELKYYNNLIEGFTYDSDFSYVGEVAMTAPLIAGS